MTKKTQKDWRNNPANELERLIACLPPVHIELLQAHLIKLCNETNGAIGPIDGKFEEAIRAMNTNPVLFRNVAREFRAPVEYALKKLVDNI